MKCRYGDCTYPARWQAILIMAPPSASAQAVPVGLPSPLLCCDRHKAVARPLQALGPNGMELLAAAFKVMGKKPPQEGDLGIDWRAYDGGPLDWGSSLASAPKPG